MEKPPAGVLLPVAPGASMNQELPPEAVLSRRMTPVAGSGRGGVGTADFESRGGSAGHSHTHVPAEGVGEVQAGDVGREDAVVQCAGEVRGVGVEGSRLAAELGGVGGVRGVGSCGETLTRSENGEAGAVGAGEARVGAGLDFEEALLAGELGAKVELNGELAVGYGDVIGAENSELAAAGWGVVEREPDVVDAVGG